MKIFYTVLDDVRQALRLLLLLEILQGGKIRTGTKHGMIEALGVLEVGGILEVSCYTVGRETIRSVGVFTVPVSRLDFFLAFVGGERYVLWPKRGIYAVFEHQVGAHVCKL